MHATQLGSNRLEHFIRPLGIASLDSLESRSRLTLDEALRRFRGEAREGHYHTGRYRCNYLSWGSGPPLVFVHGLADLPTSFIMPMSILSRHYRCIAYRLPDGLDDGAYLRNYSHDDMIGDLVALLDHWGVSQASLFGSSFGSTIALAAMHAVPDRIVCAVLQGGFARRRLRLGERLLAWIARYVPGPMRRIPLRAAMMLHKQRASMAHQPDEVRDHFIECTGVPSIRAVMRRALIMDRLDLRSILPRIQHKVLLVCGDQDPLVGKECEEELLSGLPYAKKIAIAGCAHFPYYSHPETLARLVHHFLVGQYHFPTHVDYDVLVEGWHALSPRRV